MYTLFAQYVVFYVYDIFYMIIHMHIHTAHLLILFYCHGIWLSMGWYGAITSFWTSIYSLVYRHYALPSVFVTMCHLNALLLSWWSSLIFHCALWKTFCFMRLEKSRCPLNLINVNKTKNSISAFFFVWIFYWLIELSTFCFYVYKIIHHFDYFFPLSK